jgi:choline dehydrogenase-like flavoprotein
MGSRLRGNDVLHLPLERALRHPNVRLLTNAYVERLGTDPTGRVVNSVQVRRGGVAENYSADVVVVSCGAINSLLRLVRRGQSIADRDRQCAARGRSSAGAVGVGR